MSDERCPAFEFYNKDQCHYRFFVLLSNYLSQNEVFALIILKFTK
jgi:hypothetical protein